LDGIFEYSFLCVIPNSPNTIYLFFNLVGLDTENVSIYIWNIFEI
jgi:hypothetical protein